MLLIIGRAYVQFYSKENEIIYTFNIFVYSPLPDHTTDEAGARKILVYVQKQMTAIGKMETKIL